MFVATWVGLKRLKAPSIAPSGADGPLDDGPLDDGTLVDGALDDDGTLDDGTLDDGTRPARLGSEASRMPESGRVKLLLRPCAEDGRRAVLGGRRYRLPWST